MRDAAVRGREHPQGSRRHGDAPLTASAVTASCRFLASPPSHPNSARLHQPQGEAKSTPELEQAVREYAKNGNLDKLMAILEAKIANLDAADTAVSKHAKLKASYLEHSHTYGRCVAV